MAKILVLGGTSWLGGTLAERALEAGHDVTCLARGESGTAPAGARFVRADRGAPGAYEEVVEDSWDEVIEVSWQPGLVRGAVAALGGHAGHWTYVSSTSAYADDSTPGDDEDAELRVPLAVDDAAPQEYGEAKVACEAVCLDALGDRALVVRAGLIGGPGDRSDRFGYWVSRFALAADGPVLVPDAAEQPTQVIDVRDVADWLLLAAGRGVVGVYNAVGAQTSLGEVLRTSRALAGHRGEIVEAPESWLMTQRVEPWMGPRSLPLWLPGPELAGHAARADARAVAAGLVRRPLAQSLRDSLADERTLGLDRARRAGLTRTEELELVELIRGGRSAAAAASS